MEEYNFQRSEALMLHQELAPNSWVMIHLKGLMISRLKVQA